MNRIHWCILLLLYGANGACAEETLKNGDFTQGTAYWRGEGKIVMLDENDQIIPKTNFAGNAKKGKPAIEIELSENHVSGITQTFRRTPFAHGFTVEYTFVAESEVRFDLRAKLTPGLVKSASPDQSWDRMITPWCSMGLEDSLCNHTGDPIREGGGLTTSPIPKGSKWTASAITGGGANKPEQYRTYLVFRPGKGKVLIKSVTAIKRES